MTNQAEIQQAFNKIHAVSVQQWQVILEKLDAPDSGLIPNDTKHNVGILLASIGVTMNVLDFDTVIALLTPENYKDESIANLVSTIAHYNLAETNLAGALDLLAKI